VGAEFLPVAPTRAVWRTMIRTLCALLPPLLLVDALVGLWSADHRCLHDRLSRTSCIRRGCEPGSSLPRERWWSLSALRRLWRGTAYERHTPGEWTSGPEFPDRRPLPDSERKR